ncbi:MAG: glutaredoxin family protein [Agitococcus sp.]|nr:glutaredoxin family protein [Agitococcus sp.]MDO9177895.1 glutaredoxin family protein [Agitococcus sp.]
MLTLYGTKGCHLCDEAEVLLTQAQMAVAFQWQYIDIALDDNLVKKYGIRIPVLEKETGQLLNWPFSLLDVVELAC